MQEEQSNRVLFMYKGASLDTELHMTNERTLLSWLGTSVFLSLSALSLFALQTRAASYGGMAVSFVAVVLAVYGLLRFQWRRWTLSNSDSLRPFVDRTGPTLAVFLMLGLFVALLILNNQF
jgi:uncharacterized membrane protein YidH (DUF202 family)